MLSISSVLVLFRKVEEELFGHGDGGIVDPARIVAPEPPIVQASLISDREQGCRCRLAGAGVAQSSYISDESGGCREIRRYR